MKTESLGVFLAAGDVVRCHTMPCLNRPTVGLHTWRTLVLLHWLYDAAAAYPPPIVTYTMLMHDVPEVYTGDVPGDAKADNSELSRALDTLEDTFSQAHGMHVTRTGLTYTEELVIKFCDRADLVLYGLEETEMGNTRIAGMVHRAYSMTSEFWDKLRENENAMPTPIRERANALMASLRVRMRGVLIG